MRETFDEFMESALRDARALVGKDIHINKNADVLLMGILRRLHTRMVLAEEAIKSLRVVGDDDVC